jgi:7-cyano-7-deazaguanine synthase
MGMNQAAEKVAVLASGGLDSSVLVGDLVRQGRHVRPIFIRAGLQWEAIELDYLQRFLKTIAAPGLAELVVLDMPVRDLYGAHWAMTGLDVPDADSPDAAVYLPGRNLLLTLKAMLWCHLHDVPALALGILKGNPFPDATDKFFQDFATAVNAGIDGKLRIERPYAHLTKVEVLARGRGLPLEWTLSCLQPRDGRHCGECNKCAERRKAFAAAGLKDPAEQ